MFLCTTELENRMRDLRSQMGKAVDLEQANRLNEDITRCQRALNAEREINAPVGRASAERSVATLDADEWRAKAETDLNTATVTPVGVDRYKHLDGQPD
jgi:hypothetical protein